MTRGFLGIHGVDGDQGFLELTKLLLQAFGEELLLEPRGWALLGMGWPGDWVTEARQGWDRVALMLN
jgi:hypothetical protein